MASQQYQFKVKMTCGGCSGAVTRVLTKAKTEGGVQDFTVDLPTQMVNVTSTLPFNDVKERIAKTGKEILTAEVLTGATTA